MIRPENMPLPNPQAFQDIHFGVGLALWHIQAFENTLSYFIAIILKMPPSRAEEEAIRILEKLQSLTLGGLITELRKANSSKSVSEFERRMNLFLDERNWLVHRSWLQHHGDVYHVERVPALMQRLEALAKEASELQRYFGQLTTTWTVQDGHAAEEIDRKTLEVLKQRGIIR